MSRTLEFPSHHSRPAEPEQYGAERVELLAVFGLHVLLVRPIEVVVLPQVTVGVDHRVPVVAHACLPLRTASGTARRRPIRRPSGEVGVRPPDRGPRGPSSSTGHRAATALTA